jgi:hypothetical protein
MELTLAVLVYALATLSLSYPALVGQFLVTPVSDQYIGGFPVREFAAAFEKAGKGVPLWNPYIFGGMPFVHTMNGDMFYPTAALRILLPTDVAMTWGLIVHVFLAGLFMFLFLRAVGLTFWGALLGGLAYMLAGNVAGLVSPGHDGKLFVAALLPLTLLFVHRGLRDGRRMAWGALAIVILLAVLSPHPQALQYLLLVAGAYALFVAASPNSVGERLPVAEAVRRLALASAAVALGILGGAIQYAPLLEYTPWSPRAGGKEWEHAISYSMPPEEMINFYLPQFSGILGQYWGRNLIHLHSEYLGAAVLVVAGLAYGVKHSLRPFVRFWTAVFVMAILWALGGFTPFFHLVYALVPGTKYFRAPSVMLFVVSFCVAVLTGVGADRALRSPPRRTYALLWIGVAFLVALVATTGGLTNVALTIADPQRADYVDANSAALTMGAWRAFLAVSATAGVLLLLSEGRLRTSVAGWTLAAVFAVDLWSIERLYWRFSSGAKELYASDPAIEYLRRLPQPGRVAPLGLAPLSGRIRDPYIGHGDGQADGLMLHHVRSVVGYHGNEIGRYDLLTGWNDDWPARVGNPTLRRLTNLRYLYTNGAQAPFPGMRAILGPVKNVAGNYIYLYEFAEANPPAWVVPVAVKVPDENVLVTLFDPRFDVGRAALFDTAAAVPTLPVPPSLPPAVNISVRIDRWDPGEIAVTLDRPSPPNTTLMISENYFPGWTAHADGKVVPVGRADYVLIGAPLPTGSRKIELSFAAPRYELGKRITLVVVALAVLWLVGEAVAQRRVS